MNFKQAIEEMKKGKKVRRKGWKDVWFTLDNGGALLRNVPGSYNKKTTITGLEPLTLESVENVYANDWEILEEKKKWWEPKFDETYWSIRPWSGTVRTCYNDHKIDGFAVSMGLCFQTEEQADFITEKLKVIHELEKFAFENNEEEIDWSDVNQEKLYLGMSFKNKSIDIFHTCNWIYIPFNVLFTSEEIAEKAIETIGEDRIKKYYFGVEDE